MHHEILQNLWRIYDVETQELVKLNEGCKEWSLNTNYALVFLWIKEFQSSKTSPVLLFMESFILGRLMMFAPNEHNRV